MEWIWTGIVLLVPAIVVAGAAGEFTATYAGERKAQRAAIGIFALAVISIIVGIWVVN